MRYAGSFARSCATSRGSEELERPGSRPDAGGVSAMAFFEQENRALPGGQRVGFGV